MKKIIALTTVMTLSSLAFAEPHHGGFQHNEAKSQHQVQQGFYDESAVVKTVKEALAAQDDTPIMLEGKIIKQVGKNEFLFQDATGEATIEVSKRAWQGQQVSPQDTIQVKGKVDKEWNKTELDIKQVIKK